MIDLHTTRLRQPVSTRSDLIDLLPVDPALIPAERERLIAAFRAELRARDVEPARIYRTGGGDAVTYTRCLMEGADARGYAIEVLPPRNGSFQPYQRLTWKVEGESPGKPGQVELYASTTFGLIRLQREEEPAVWLWSLEANMAGNRWHEVLIAAEAEAPIVELLQASHEEFVRRERKKTLLLFTGMSERWVEPGKERWEDVILPEGLRTEIRRTIEGFFAAADLYAQHDIPHRRGVLLAGEPGNGKTSLLKVLGAQLDLPVVVATLIDSRPLWIKEVFERAQSLAPAVLCFEDLDALIDDDGERLSTFLNLLDGVVPLDGVLVIATTNRPDRIDPAISRRPSRFDRVFLIPRPQEPQREEFLTKLLGERAPDGAAARLAAETEGYSMAFLKELVLQGRLHAVQRGAVEVTDEDLDQALANTREHLQLAARGLEERGQVGF